MDFGCAFEFPIFPVLLSVPPPPLVDGEIMAKKEKYPMLLVPRQGSTVFLVPSQSTKAWVPPGRAHASRHPRLGQWILHWLLLITVATHPVQQNRSPLTEGLQS